MSKGQSILHYAPAARQLRLHRSSATQLILLNHFPLGVCGLGFKGTRLLGAGGFLGVFCGVSDPFLTGPLLERCEDLRCELIYFLTSLAALWERGWLAPEGSWEYCWA